MNAETGSIHARNHIDWQMTFQNIVHNRFAPVGYNSRYMCVILFCPLIGIIHGLVALAIHHEDVNSHLIRFQEDWIDEVRLSGRPGCVLMYTWIVCGTEFYWAVL